MSAGAASSSSTLLVAARASLLHKQVTVELINGLRITGRIVQFDAETMNVKLDSITSTELVYKSGSHLETADVLQRPPQLPAMHSIALRGSTIKWLDVASDEPSGAAVSVEAAVRLVRAGGLVEGG
jgi:small nuclear ribonucleoprotein (snRNP)-like protein